MSPRVESKNANWPTSVRPLVELAASAAQYALLASFLAIAFLSAFHRERLCGLLKLERKNPPVPEPPPMPFVQP